ncbi:MAG: Acetyl-CoA:oxalate CoA-transferase [Alphaproteobacteria bacterium MarineAlpha2_Bin1]|nr:MAG: Acetyl-CoA:oxalate CoA-transferase [Alphaproteobacteria bacterium MarineAlpha2_Bin1]
MKALEDVVMLDLTHMLSGPYGAMILTDLGAKSIKIEPPGKGEGTRALQARDPKNSLHGMGSYYLTLNRGKKSVCIDLKKEEGLKLFYDMVKKADIVFNNFSAGVPEKLKIDFKTLSKINPKIITCSVTGFGETGPYNKRPSFDMVAQATGGGMSITGTRETSQFRAGIPIGDLGGGIFGAIGILAALHQRNLTNRGQHVDVAMLDGQISMLNYMATMYFLSGENPYGIGNSHFVHVPYNVFETQTLSVVLAIITDNFYESLADLLDDDFLKQEKYKTQPGRFVDKRKIEECVQNHFKNKPAEFWLEKLESARIPHAPVNDFEHALKDPQVLARGMVVDIPHTDGGSFKAPGNPVKLDDHTDTWESPPKLGEHTDEILKDFLNKNDEEISILRQNGIIE